MKRLLIILALISGLMFGVLSAQGQLYSGLLAPNRANNWSNAGATIESRTTQCGSTILAGASAATIQAAISACAGSHQYVLLGPGTFSLPSSLVITYAGALNVTLRGSGPTQTILKFTGTSTNCNGIGTVGVCITNGDSSNTANGSANTLNWTAGYAKGTTTLTAGAAVTGSLSNLHVGSLIYLTQADENSDNGQWWACGSPYSGAAGVNGDCSQQGMENQWPARSTSQIVTVTGISGSNISISPGVYAPDYASGRTPYMSFSSFLPISGFGLENLTVDTQLLNGSTQAAMVEYGWALNCWVKNVSLINSVNPGGAMHKHVFIGSSQHITVRDSYMYGSSPTMEGYGIDNTLGTSDSLIENNISNHVATAFMFESTSGNVLGYNYVTDNFYVGNPPGSAPNWQGSDVSFHDAGNYYNLVEGHEGIQFSSDDIHGTAFANTLFRSYMNGRDPATQCPGGGSGCGTGTKTQDTQAIQINAFNRYFNLALNVLGTSSYFTNYQQQGASGSPTSCPSTNWTTILNLNYGASGLTPFSPTCTGSSFTIDNDSLVSTSLMRWGNYDTVNAAVRTNSGETGSTASTYPGLVSPSTAWSSYPSLYLSSRPSWWGSMPWPAVGPDVTGGNIPNVGGFAYHNPAANCYLNILGGKTDGSTGSLQSTFDANVCYSSTPTLSAPIFSPAGGSFTSLPTVTITGPSGATIRYTTDGSAPSETHGTVYSSPVAITVTGTVLQAIAYEAGFNDSAITSGTYTRVPIVLSSHSWFGTQAASASSVSTVINPAAGDGVTCEVTFVNTTTPISVSDNVNGAYTLVPGTLHNNTSIGSSTAVYYASNVSSSPATVTFTLNASVAYVGLFCQTWTPATPGTFTLDSVFTQQQDGTTANPTSGTPTAPSNNSELVLGNLLVNSTNPVAGTNFTGIDLSNNVSMAPEYWIQTSPIATNVPYVNAADLWTDQRVGFSFATTTTVATPTFSPNTGTPPQTVTISVATAGATICYTTDGSTPSASVAGTCDGSPTQTYLSPVAVSVNPTTLKAIGTKSGSVNSAVGSATFTGTPTASTPVFTPSGGTQLAGTVISISTTPSACNQYIYWSRNTTPPTTGDVNGTGGPIFSSATYYAKVIGCPGYLDSAVGSATYTVIQTYNFTLNPSTNGTVTGCATGSYAAGTTISCTPNPNSGYAFAQWTGLTSVPCATLTSNPCIFQLNGNITLGATFSQLFTLSTATAGTGSGTISGCAGSYVAGASYSCSISPNAGSGLTSVSGCGGSGTSTYAGVMPSSNCTVTATFTLQAASTPTFSPTPGAYGSAQTVTISTSTTGATICYTTDGSTPTTNGAGSCVHGSSYSVPFTVSSTTTIKAIATKSGNADSGIGTATYTINGTAAAPQFSPPAGSYGPSQSVTIFSATPGVTICYTNDGSLPSADGAGTCTHGTTYSSPVTVASSQTLKAIASKSGWIDSSVSTAAYVVNGAASTPTFLPTAGTYTTPQIVTITASGGSPVIVNSMAETSNANDSSGSTPHRNTYTNCATGYSGGQLQPAGQPVGQLYCTTADKTAAVAAGGPNNGVVTSTISGTGTSALDNGNGAGGTDSPTSVTATYAGTGTGCGVGTNVASTLVSGLTLPGAISNAQAVFSITTGSNPSTSLLSVTKYNTSGDSGRYLVREDCASPNTISVGGEHYEWDSNYTSTTGSYFGFGFDYNFVTSKFRTCPQGCSGWTDVELAPVGGGSAITTYSWPANNYLYSQRYDYWDAGCSYSGSNCAHYGQICLQLWSGGSPVNSLTCYNIQNASTHSIVSFTPLNKTSWTHPQYAPQHQWDINATSQTLTATVPFDSLVAYSLSGSPTICYTLDGSTPTSSSPGVCASGSLQYSGPITVSSSETIKAIATNTGFSDSSVASASYVITGTVGNPVFAPTAGSYASAQSVTILSVTSGATLCYTTDGSTPTASGGTCTHGTTYAGPVTVSTSETINAIGSKSGYTNSSVMSSAYTINGALTAPTFSPVAGSYGGTQSVTISALSGATICFTTDGSTPTADGAGTCTHGTTYSGAVSVATSLTINAIASKSAWLDSSVGTAAYVINGPAATPTFSPVAGTYSSVQTVAISTATAGATICYTTDGTNPVSNGSGTCTHGSTYSTPVSVSSSLTLSAIASKATYLDSTVGSAAYVINVVADPTFSPIGGTYLVPQTVSIATTTSGATLCFTTDGSTPTTNGAGTCTHGTTYGSPIAVSTSETIKAIGTKAAFGDSTVMSAVYTIVGPSPPTALQGDVTLESMSIQ